MSGVGGPSGTVTFLFTDVEGHSRLWEAFPDRMERALECHDDILRDAIGRHGGYVFATGGDAFCAAFASVNEAVETAAEAQQRLAVADWPEGCELRVRMGLHTGEAQERDGDYFGPAVIRAARIMSAGHGGQVLLSTATAALVGGRELRPLGTHRLKDLSAPEEIHQLEAADFPPLATLDRVLHNLPVQTTVLVGRDEAIEEVAQLAREHRLVTLLGIGGSGKTRLSQAVAGHLVEDFPDGVWFVDLVPVLDGHRIAEAIAVASGLNATGGADALSRLCSVLAPRRCLIVLDNCEHLTESAADVVEELMRSTPSVHVLATSREPLELLEEHRQAVEPLALGDDRATPAMILFEDAAARVGVTIGDDDLDDALAVCRHLDGLPLALELAGAQLRHLTPAQLRERMDDRFGLLERGRRSRGHRQESLLRVLEDSYDMLVDEERDLLSLLAAFPSTFDVDAVEAVADGLVRGPVSRALAGLIDRNLVVAESPGRFRLLETVKLFARDTWPDDDSGADAADHPLERHTRWLIDVLVDQPREARYVSSELALWLAQRYEDVVVVEDRLREHHRLRELAELYGSLNLAMFIYLGNARTLAVGERIEAALAELDFTEHEQALLHATLGTGSLGGRRLDWLAESSARAFELADPSVDPVDHAYAVMLGSWGKALRDTDAAVEMAVEAAQLAEDAGAPRLGAYCHAYRINHLMVGGRIAEARAIFDEVESIVLATETGYDQALGGFNGLACGLYVLDEPDRALASARVQLEESLANTAGIEIGETLALASLDEVDPLLESLVVLERGFERVGEDGLPDLLLPAVLLAWRRGNVELARRWLTAIRHAPKPTQNFVMTAIYRQLRDKVGLDPTPPTEPIEETWAEAREWMHQDGPREPHTD